MAFAPTCKRGPNASASLTALEGPLGCHRLAAPSCSPKQGQPSATGKTLTFPTGNVVATLARNAISGTLKPYANCGREGLGREDSNLQPPVITTPPKPTNRPKNAP